MGGLIRRGLAPQVPAKIKSPLSFSKIPKKEKDLQTEVLKDWECGKNLKKVIKKLFDNASVKVYNNNTGNTCWQQMSPAVGTQTVATSIQVSRSRA